MIAVRPGGAEHQWRKIPPDPVAMQFDFAAERFGEPFKRLLWTLRDLLLMWFGRRHCHDIRPSYAYGFEAVPGAPLQARARHRGYQLANDLPSHASAAADHDHGLARQWKHSVLLEPVLTHTIYGWDGYV